MVRGHLHDFNKKAGLFECMHPHPVGNLYVGVDSSPALRGEIVAFGLTNAPAGFYVIPVHQISICLWSKHVKSPCLIMFC